MTFSSSCPTLPLLNDPVFHQCSQTGLAGFHWLMIALCLALGCLAFPFNAAGGRHINVLPGSNSRFKLCTGHPTSATPTLIFSVPLGTNEYVTKGVAQVSPAYIASSTCELSAIFSMAGNTVPRSRQHLRIQVPCGAPASPFRHFGWHVEWWFRHLLRHSSRPMGRAVTGYTDFPLTQEST